MGMHYGGRPRTLRARIIQAWLQPRKPHSTVMLLCLLTFMTYLNLARVAYAQFPITPLAAAAQATVSPEPRSQTTNVPAESQNGSLATQTSAPSKNIEVAKPCSGTPYSVPTQLSLTSAPAGLSTVIDAPTNYQVYGDSIANLRDAIESCPLRKAIGSYHAVTTYQVSWSYGFHVSNSVCRLSDVRVGMHINQYLPLFVPSAATPQTTASSWQQYIAVLQQHENGHVAIDTDYAKRLTAALQNLATTDCGSIAAQASTITDSYVTMLNTANDLYDSRTNHGLTQGAVL